MMRIRFVYERRPCATKLKMSHALAKKLFVAFLSINQFRRVGLKFVCWFYVGNTQSFTESCFMEKSGIKPATPGLQGIALIHYTTAVFVFGRVPWLYLYWSGGFMRFVVLCPGTPEGSTGKDSGF